MNKTLVNQNLRYPENLHVVTHEGASNGFIHSQDFLFGEFNMGRKKKSKFTRLKGPLCGCNCGGFAKPGRKFIAGHHMKDKRPHNKGQTGKDSLNWKERIIVYCLWCGKSKEILPSVKSNNSFCNHKCMGKWYSKNRQKENNPAWGGDRITVFCSTCGKSKDIPPSEKSKNGNYFCNPECQNNWKEKTTVFCAQCGKPKKITPHAQKFENHFCNYKCHMLWQSEYMLNGGAAYVASFAKNPSKPQVELFELIKELYPRAILNYPSLNCLIDIAIPNKMIAIEYDGSYWHDQEADDKRQKLLENIGWKFLRYVDYVPSINELEKDLKTLILF